MATIYIANSTQQEYELHCRLPEQKTLLVQNISSGREIELKSLSAGEMEALIRHLERFGALPRARVRGSLKKFVGIVYSLDKPISKSEIHYGHEGVLDHAQERAVEEAVRSAQAADVVQRDRRGRRNAKITEVSVQEEHPEKGKKPLAMNIAVADDYNDHIRLQ